MKNFNESKCIEELYKQHWEYIYFFCTDPNVVWELWIELFLKILNKHAPLQHKKIKSNKVRKSNKLVNRALFSGGSRVSQNKLPQLILGYIYILKYLQSNFIG